MSDEREFYSLSNIILAGRLDQSVVYVPLDTLIHALVDLVNEGKWRFREVGE